MVPEGYKLSGQTSESARFAPGKSKANHPACKSFWRLPKVGGTIGKSKAEVEGFTIIDQASTIVAFALALKGRNGIPHQSVTRQDSRPMTGSEGSDGCPTR